MAYSAALHVPDRLRLFSQWWQHNWPSLSHIDFGRELLVYLTVIL